ncbi:MAG: AMP-binding protein, partial [Burkholderiaceae bacterium]
MDELLARSSERVLLDIVQGTVRDLRAEIPAALRVTLDSSLDRDLAFDSLARVELLLRIEHAFGVDLPEDTLQSAETVRDLLSAVKRARDTLPTMHGGTGEVSTPLAPPMAALREDDAGVPSAVTTLLEVFDWHLHAHADQIQIVVLADGTQQEISYAKLAAGARVIGANLQRAGLQPRQSVAIMLPTSPEYFDTYFGILLAGGIPVPIYPPARASQLEDHVLRHAGILANAQVVMLVTVPEAMIVARLLQARVPGLRHVMTPQQLAQPGGALEPLSVKGDDIAFIQYTSGSTGNPKGVVLTHANLLANIRAMAQAVAASPSDVFVSWLPLYHDMGLIGAFLGSLYVGFPLVVMSPLAFLAKPERWLWAIHRYRGTISAAPNFAYELCLKRIDDAALEGLDLSSWRLAFNGAEAVSPDTIERFVQRFAHYGLRREAIAP